MSNLATEKINPNFNWFDGKKIDEKIEAKKNKELFLSVLLIFLSIQATLSLNNIFETRKNYMFYKKNVNTVISLRENLNKAILDKNEEKIVENYNKLLTTSALGALTAGQSAMMISNSKEISLGTKQKIKDNFNTLSYIAVNKELIDFQKNSICSVMNFSCVLMQNYKYDSFTKKDNWTRQDLATMKFNLNNIEGYKKFNDELLSKKITVYYEQYLNSMNQYKSREVYKSFQDL